MDKKEALEKIAKKLRIHSLKMTSTAGSGHPTTCLSAAEIIAYYTDHSPNHRNM